METRRFRRVPVAIRVLARDGASAFPEDTCDLSAGGFSLKTNRPLPEGTRTTFDFVLPPDDQVLSLSGEVVWSRRGGMGVRFTSAPGDRLYALVDKLIKDADRI